MEADPQRALTSESGSDSTPGGFPRPLLWTRSGGSVKEGDTAWAMSEENVEIVRKSVDAVNRGDIEEVLAFTDADAELHSAIIGGRKATSTEATTASASGSRSRQKALSSSTLS
jgi:hypothetical protein